MVLGALLGGSLFLGADLLARTLRDPAISPLFQIGAVVVVIYCIYGAIVGVLNGQRRFQKQAGLDMTFALLRTAGFIGGAAVAGTALATLSGWMVAAGALLIVAFVFAGRHLRGSGQAISWRRWLLFMAPVGVYQFSLNAMLLLDIHVLKRSVDDLASQAGLQHTADFASEQVAYYGAAQTFAMVPYQLILSLAFIVFPMVSRATSAGDEAGARSTIRVAMRFALLVLLAIAAPIAGAARGVLLLAFPENYVAGSPALGVLVFGMAAMGLYVILATSLVSAGRAGTAAGIALIGTCCVVAMGRLLVMRGDLDEGVLDRAALGTASGMALACVLAIAAVSRRFGFPFAPLSIVRIGAAAAGAFYAARAIPHETRLSALGALVGGGFVYLAILALTQELRRQDIEDALRASVAKVAQELTLAGNSRERSPVVQDKSDPRRNVYGRLLSAAIFLGCVLMFGATAYFQLGGGRWTWFDCFYMTIITLSTVGFGETLEGMHEVPEARAVTMALIVIGSGTLLYFLSNLTALIVEGDLQGILRNRGMQRRIDRLEGHVVVCVAGNTGEHVVGELIDVNCPFVVIDANVDRVRVLGEDLHADLLHVVGDATDDHSLERAGVARAKGVIAALHDDKDNLFVTISVRHLNPSARIVAKAIESSSIPKLRRAGADAIVSPNQIGGLRLVNEMIRPTAVEFMDRLLRTDEKLRIEDVKVPENSNLVDHSLAQCMIRETGALVLAVRHPNGDYVYNPGSDLKIKAGSSLIVIAHTDGVARLQQGLRDNSLLRV